MEFLIRERAVEGVRVGRYPWAINTTCLVYRLGTTLIDTGPPNQFRRVCDFANARPLTQILLTHHHEDHCGNAARLTAELQSPVLAPRAALQFLADGFQVHLYRRLVWGKPRRVRAAPLPDEIDAGAGFRLQPIATPGHSIDMTCFLEPDEGWLFSGDLFVTAKPRYLRKDEDVNQTVSSLRGLLQFEFGTLFCAHRGLVRDARSKVAAKLNYLTELRQEVRERRRQGDTPAAITRQLLGKEDFLSWFSGGHFSKRNLVEACLS